MYAIPVDCTADFAILLYATVAVFVLAGIGILMDGSNLRLDLPRAFRRLRRRVSGKPMRVVREQQA